MVKNQNIFKKIPVNKKVVPKVEDSLFPEIGLGLQDKIIIINKQRLLEILNNTAEQNSLQTLRQKIYNLTDQLTSFVDDKSGIWNVGTNGDTIQMNQVSLAKELKQIVETLTLERARYYVKRLAKSIVMGQLWVDFGYSWTILFSLL